MGADCREGTQCYFGRVIDDFYMVISAEASSACLLESVAKLDAERVAGRTFESQLKDARLDVPVVHDHPSCFSVDQHGIALGGWSVLSGKKFDRRYLAISPVDVQIAAFGEKRATQSGIPFATAFGPVEKALSNGRGG